MNFSNVIEKWPEKKKTKFYSSLRKYGDITQIVSYIDNMQPSFQSKSVEMAIDERFFVLKRKKSFLILPTNTLKYYYTSIDVVNGWIIPWRTHTIGLILQNDFSFEYELKSEKDLETNAVAIQKFVKGFENIAPSYREYEVPIFSGRIIINSQQLLYTSQSKKLFKNETYEKNILNIKPISNIIWCTQYHDFPSEETDSYGLNFYLADGSVHSINLGNISMKDTFKVALYLKQNIPHLLYGSNSEYRRIFKESPQKLMAIAKEKCSE